MTVVSGGMITWKSPSAAPSRAWSPGLRPAPGRPAAAPGGQRPPLPGPAAQHEGLGTGRHADAGGRAPVHCAGPRPASVREFERMMRALSPDEVDLGHPPRTIIDYAMRLARWMSREK